MDPPKTIEEVASCRAALDAKAKAIQEGEVDVAPAAEPAPEPEVAKSAGMRGLQELLGGGPSLPGQAEAKEKAEMDDFLDGANFFFYFYFTSLLHHFASIFFFATLHVLVAVASLAAHLSHAPSFRVVFGLRLDSIWTQTTWFCRRQASKSHDFLSLCVRDPAACVVLAANNDVAVYAALRHFIPLLCHAIVLHSSLLRTLLHCI